MDAAQPPSSAGKQLTAPGCWSVLLPIFMTPLLFLSHSDLGKHVLPGSLEALLADLAYRRRFLLLIYAATAIPIVVVLARRRRGWDLACVVLSIAYCGLAWLALDFLCLQD